MDEELFTFSEAKKIIIEEINNIKLGLIKEQHEKYVVLSKMPRNDTLRMIDILLQNEISERRKAISNIQNTITLSSKLDMDEQEETHYDFRKNRLNHKLKTCVLAHDKEWRLKTKCTLAQMRFLIYAIADKDKHDFYSIFSILTNNESMAQRYTKYIFGSGIKHSKS